MARIPEGIGAAALTVAARRILLDALEALAPHRAAVVLVGAQAVYLRSEDAPVQVAAFTADADLSLLPSRLGEAPLLEEVMRGAGFSPGAQPGIWTRSERVGAIEVPMAVDLLVPAAFGGSGRRAAKIPPHDRLVARKVDGLEPAAVDHDELIVSSLDAERDPRRVSVNVAGVAALLVAKAFKINDRVRDPRPGREADKDAGDVLRLMTTADAHVVAARFQALLAHPDAAEATARGLVHLRSLFGRAQSSGTDMAVAALAGGGVPETTIRQVAAAFVAMLPDGRQ